MRQLLSDSDDSGEPGFHKIVDGFLLQPGLPFAGVLSSEKMNRIFRKHGGLFGGSGIYNTAIVLWAFLGQVLHNGKEASCQAAVAGIISFCLQVERDAPTEDTGDYCRARARLSEPAFRELSAEIANEAEQQADAAWLWKRRHAKLTDGFTFTMPDTEKNQAEFPHPRTQMKGVGLPIAPCVVILSLVTCIDAGRIVRQTLRHPGWQRCLHFDIQKSTMLVSRQNVQNRQLVVVTVFPQKRIQNFDMRDLWLIGQNRVQKVDRHTGMLRTPQHQLERKIHRWTDTNCHVSATTDSSRPPSTTYRTAGRSVTAGDTDGIQGRRAVCCRVSQTKSQQIHLHVLSEQTLDEPN